MTSLQTTHQVLKQLDHLKLTQLQRLAVSLGTQCSGTKTAIKSSIKQSLPKAASNTTRPQPRLPLSLVSIDMGIRNLAYAHLTADLDARQTKPTSLSCYQRPRLRAWKKIAIAPAASTDTSALNDEKDTPASSTLKLKADPESFAPELYATHAVRLITSIIHAHNPTHILIERQRFRSGGSPVVQDWSIRVGVFEGMLYAVLQTLAEKCGVDVCVEGVLPGRVVRFWAAHAEKGTPGSGGSADAGPGPVPVPKGKAVKKLKIDFVGRALEESVQAGKKPDSSLEIDATALPMVSAYLAKWTKESRSRSLPNIGHDSESLPELSKLDDLADSLLQGMAWIEWENNRARVAAWEDVEAMLSVR